jgi:predicted DNA-binding transcriptional regulator AlpA
MTLEGVMKDHMEAQKGPDDLASLIESKRRALQANELADLLRMKRSTIYQQTKTGFIPSIRINGSVRYDCFAIAEWLRGLTINPYRRSATKKSTKDTRP